MHLGRLDVRDARCHAQRMSSSPASRCRALWLVLLLVFTPAGPAGLLASGHGPGKDDHAGQLVHDPADHGISSGALAPDAADAACPYCQLLSTHRLALPAAAVTVETPRVVALIARHDPSAALRSRLLHALPARAPPPSA